MRAPEFNAAQNFGDSSAGTTSPFDKIPSNIPYAPAYKHFRQDQQRQGNEKPHVSLDIANERKLYPSQEVSLHQGQDR